MDGESGDKRWLCKRDRFVQCKSGGVEGEKGWRDLIKRKTAGLYVSKKALVEGSRAVLLKEWNSANIGKCRASSFKRGDGPNLYSKNWVSWGVVKQLINAAVV